MKEENSIIQTVRGDGLMQAAVLDVPGKEIVRQAVEAGFLFNCTQEKVLRFLPPLTLERKHVDELMAGLRPILAAAASARKEVNA